MDKYAKYVENLGKGKKGLHFIKGRDIINVAWSCVREIKLLFLEPLAV